MTPSTKYPNLVRSTGVTFRLSTIGKIFATILPLILAGLLLSPIEGRLWEVAKRNIPQTSGGDTFTQAGQGMLLATPGGFRSLLADIQWLGTCAAWEKEDATKTLSSIQFTVALDPRPAFFWRNGANMIAYDMRHWESTVQTLGGGSEGAVGQILARVAIDFLRQGMRQHPEDYTFPVDIGHIYMTRLEDYDAAAEAYLHACKNYPDVPYYVGRLHAQLLRKAGRNREAYDFLVKEYTGLPSNDPYAQKELVLRRIRNLEVEMGIPVESRFEP